MGVHNTRMVINEDTFLGKFFQDVFTTPEGRAARQERRDLRAESKAAERFGKASQAEGIGAALTADAQRDGSESNNNMLFLIGGGFLLLLIIGVVLFMVLKKK
jgi:hypothetical protein